MKALAIKESKWDLYKVIVEPDWGCEEILDLEYQLDGLDLLSKNDFAKIKNGKYVLTLLVATKSGNLLYADAYKEKNRLVLDEYFRDGPHRTSFRVPRKYHEALHNAQ